MIVISIAISLPIILFVFTFLGFHREDEEIVSNSFRHAFIQASIITNLALLFLMEVLSLISAIHTAGLLAGWFVCIALIALYSVRSGALDRGAKRFWRQIAGLQGRDRLLIFPFITILSLLFMVAIASPANNADSLIYHMPRVVQWAQNQNLNHFSTTNYKQLINPIWPELAILNLRVLVGSDLPVNLVQWFCMLASMIGVTSIASIMGLNRWGQWLTAAFSISIPMGILQATSTQTDYVAAFWTVCLMYFVVLGKRRGLSRVENACLGISLGLGMLSKGTFFAYAPPILLWHFIPRLRRPELGRTFIQALLIVSIAVAVNSSYWIRNTETFGGPYGGSGFLDNILFFRRPVSALILPEQEIVASNWRSAPAIKAGRQANNNFLPTESSMLGKDVSPVTDFFHSWSVRVIQMLSMNLVTPNHFANKHIFEFLQRLPRIFPIGFIDSLKNAAWNHEDTAGSPVHLVLFALSICLLGLLYRSKSSIKVHNYGLVLLGGFAILALIRTSTVVYSVRYQLPFFVLASPFVGQAFTLFDRPRLRNLAIGILLLYTMPYVLFNNMRPIVGIKPWPTRTRSVFLTPKEEVIFAISPHLQLDYQDATARIRSNACTRVGLQIRNPELEYLFWFLLEAPQSGISIQTMNPSFGLEKFFNSNFSPCAVLCTVCDDQSEAFGLPLVYDYGYLSLYALFGTLGEPSDIK